MEDTQGATKKQSSLDRAKEITESKVQDLFEDGLQWIRMNAIFLVLVSCLVSPSEFISLALFRFFVSQVLKTMVSTYLIFSCGNVKEMQKRMEEVRSISLLCSYLFLILFIGFFVRSSILTLIFLLVKAYSPNITKSILDNSKAKFNNRVHKVCLSLNQTLWKKPIIRFACLLVNPENEFIIGKFANSLKQKIHVD